LHRWIIDTVGSDVAGKAFVDTGPLLERDLARRAGLGWFGKNTTLINSRLGSFFFLGALLIDLELTPDEPFATDHCGTCRRCLDACPTGALVEPQVLDSNLCISYLTIEAKGAIPEAMRAGIGELIYGCDICQEVCPWNVRFSKELTEPAFAAREAIAGKDARTLAREILAMSDEDFRTALKGSPMKRAKLRGLKRNAATSLGNIANPDDMSVLMTALDHPDQVVREHAAWALNRFRSH
jgi:epoxyqueuosine reductase